jgi:hypothetical protein
LVSVLGCGTWFSLIEEQLYCRIFEAWFFHLRNSLPDTFLSYYEMVV